MAIEEQESTEGRREKVAFLIEHLLTEMPAYREEAARIPRDRQAQRDFLRALMNVRPPIPLQADFLRVQDALLTEEREARGVVDGAALPTVEEERRTAMARGAASGARLNTADENFVLWQGDITRLAVDAIVNAANSALRGCFVPLHRCIDNAIHSAAGLALRAACDEIMREQGHLEPAGRAKITPGFNLPARHVLHPVGPILAPVPRATARASTSRRSEDWFPSLSAAYRRASFTTRRRKPPRQPLRPAARGFMRMTRRCASCSMCSRTRIWRFIAGSFSFDF